MFRLPLSVLRANRVSRPAPVRRILAPPQTSCIATVRPFVERSWQTRPARQVALENATGSVVPSVGRHLSVTGKVLASFVTIVLGRREGYDRYLKREAEQLVRHGRGWAGMTLRERRDIIRARLTRLLNNEYLQGARSTAFVRPSYRGNPVRVYRDDQNRAFAFVLSSERPAVIGIFTLNRFLRTDRKRRSRSGRMRPETTRSVAGDPTE